MNDHQVCEIIWHENQSGSISYNVVNPSVAHFRGITALVDHVRKHPTYVTQHGFLAGWGFVQQVKMLGYSLKHTSSLRGSSILT